MRQDDRSSKDLLDALVVEIGSTQAHVASTCAEGHDLTPSTALLDAIHTLRSRLASLEADREDAARWRFVRPFLKAHHDKGQRAGYSYVAADNDALFDATDGVGTLEIDALIDAARSSQEETRNG